LESLGRLRDACFSEPQIAIVTNGTLRGNLVLEEFLGVAAVAFKSRIAHPEDKLREAVGLLHVALTAVCRFLLLDTAGVDHFKDYLLLNAVTDGLSMEQRVTWASGVLSRFDQAWPTFVRDGAAAPAAPCLEACIALANPAYQSECNKVVAYDAARLATAAGAGQNPSQLGGGGGGRPNASIPVAGHRQAQPALPNPRPSQAAGAVRSSGAAAVNAAAARPTMRAEPIVRFQPPAGGNWEPVNAFFRDFKSAAGAGFCRDQVTRGCGRGASCKFAHALRRSPEALELTNSLAQQLPSFTFSILR